MICIERSQDSQLAPVIFQLLERVYGTSPYQLDQIVSDLANPAVSYVLAWDGANMVGFLSYQETPFDLEIEHIALLPTYRGQGLGQDLLAVLPDKEVFLEVRESNLRAQAFYRKMGFETLSIRKAYYHNPSEDAIIMKREKHG